MRTSNTPKILNIKEFAHHIRLTPNAVRIHLHRNTDALPRGFKIGKQWFWRQKDVDNWINEQAEQALRKTH